MAPATPTPASPAPALAPAGPSGSVAPGSGGSVGSAPLSAEPARSTEVTDTRRKYQRHSTGMMVTGIVMVSFVPVALLAAWVADLEQTSCERGGYYSITTDTVSRGTNCGRFDATIYGGLISAGVLMGVGVPMIIIGGKKEPLATARLSPWATPRAGGLSLRLDL